ncbi:MAG: hypothetical protein HY049_18695 [Acidobacteria bacterium]|nr:hypothetical protein [Acidobacteriota bacterium]
MRSGGLPAAVLALSVSLAGPPPGTLAPAVREALDPIGVAVASDGSPVMTFWPRLEFPEADRGAPPPATALGRDRLRLGELGRGSLVGAILVEGPWADARGRVLAPGTYTARYAVQPQLKDHVDVSPWRDFLILIPAGAADTPGALTEAEAIARSKAASGTGHPLVLGLRSPPAGASPGTLVATDEGSWMIVAGGADHAIGVVLKGP